MIRFEIVAHRGAHENVPENTLPAFHRAISLGADAVELDVRLTADRVPVVFHYFYLDEITSLPGPIFNYTYVQIQNAHAFADPALIIPTLEQVLAAIGGQIGLEIEVKGPEPEAPEIISAVLQNWRHLWPTFEVTSYEPMLLVEMGRLCPGIPRDLLFPRSESWMRLDVVAYMAAHRARLAGARAVHLHPSQLSTEVVELVRDQGIDIHTWDVNDEMALNTTLEYEIPKVCTDKPEQALDFRRRAK